MLGAAVVLVVDGTFSGVVLFAPLIIVGEGVVLRAEDLEATKKWKTVMKCTVYK